MRGKNIKNKEKNMNKETDMDKNKETDMEHWKGHLAMAVAVGVLLALTGVSAASASDPGDARGHRRGVR